MAEEGAATCARNVTAGWDSEHRSFEWVGPCPGVRRSLGGKQ